MQALLFSVFYLAANFLNWSYQSSKSCTVHVSETVEPFPKLASPEVSQNRSSSNRPRPSTSSGGKIVTSTWHSQPASLRRRRDTSNQHEVDSVFSSTFDPYLGTASTDSSSTQSAVSVMVEELDSDVLLMHDGGMHGMGSSLDSSLTMNEGADMEEDFADGSLEHVGEAGLLNTEATVTTTLQNVLHLTVPNHTNVGVTNNASGDYVHLPASDDKNPEILTQMSFKKTESSTKNTQDEDFTENPKSNMVPAVQTDGGVRGSSKTWVDSEEERFQQDAPVYLYGMDNIEIIELRHDSESTPLKKTKDPVEDLQLKPKFEVNHEFYQSSLENEVSQATSKFHKNSPNLGMELKTSSDQSRLLHEGGNTVGITNQTSLSYHSVIPVDLGTNMTLANVSNQQVTVDSPNTHHAKRVLVNVTIATEDDAGEAQSKNHQQVYVLSVAVPSLDDSNSNTASIDLSPPQQNIASVHLGLKSGASNLSATSAPSTTSSATVTSPATPSHLLWGGHCKCSCPCLDKKTSTKNESPSNLSIISGNMNETVADSDFTNQEEYKEGKVGEGRDGNLEPKETKTDSSGDIGFSTEASSLLYDYGETTNLDDESESSSFNPEELFSSSEMDTEAFNDSASTPSSVSQMETSTEGLCVQPTLPPPIILLLEGEKVCKVQNLKKKKHKKKENESVCFWMNILVFLESHFSNLH